MDGGDGFKERCMVEMKGILEGKLAPKGKGSRRLFWRENRWLLVVVMG